MGISHIRRQAFTLVELLVVIGIVTILAGILFPVFSRVREDARRSACLSNEKQLGLALLQYVQDNDETFPNGIGQDANGHYWPGEGWAGQCSAYMKSPGVLRCPSDPTPADASSGVTVSYGYNINFAGPFTAPPSPGITAAAPRAPGRSVLLFEVAGVAANAEDVREGTEPGGTEGSDFSAAGNGLDHRLYAQDLVTSRLNQYATGELGGRRANRSDPVSPWTQFDQTLGRHNGGSNFLMADGHARWLPGRSVSSGTDAPGEDCRQDDAPAMPGCGLPVGTLSAAGTGVGSADVAATFSTQ